MSLAPEVKLATLLSDEVRYSYAALTALVFHQLYPGKEDTDLRNRHLGMLLQHFSLDHVDSVMEVLMERGDHDTEPYVQLVLNEPRSEESAALLIFHTLRLAVGGGFYDARIRVVLKNTAGLLKISRDCFSLLEDLITESDDKALSEELDTPREDEEVKKKREKLRQLKKYALIGTAAITGGVLVGVTGGLAAPLVGVSLGALLGSGSAALIGAIGTIPGAAVLGSLFGAAGAGITGLKMKRRVGDVDEFRFVTLPPGRGSCLHVTVAIPGWLVPTSGGNAGQDGEATVLERLMEPWMDLSNAKEQYGLVYESSYLAELGRTLDSFNDKIVSIVASGALKLTVLEGEDPFSDFFATAIADLIGVHGWKIGELPLFMKIPLEKSQHDKGLTAAVALPKALLNLTDVIDNPWGVCCRRSVKVGQKLAETLIERKMMGNRPVTLIGFSFGARVIYYCLREMERLGSSKEIVEDAVLIGAPVTGSRSKWEPLLQVVAGRLVNAFSRNDWLLKILYGATSVAVNGVAGLKPISVEHKRLVNVDLSELIHGHADYRIKASECIRMVFQSTDDLLVIS